MKSLFIVPVEVSVVVLMMIYVWGGPIAFLLAASLAILEITLSLDNAIVNVWVLAKMSPAWQRRFLTWGMFFSVVVVRFALPILLVSLVAMVSPIDIVTLAFSKPEQYASLVAGVAPAIKSFGGIFLLLLALRYFFDETKEIHWLRFVERHLARWGQIEAISLCVALVTLLGITMVPNVPALAILQSGIIGAILFIFMKGLTGALGVETGSAGRAGLMLFIYINILDAAFSLDGVLGAFAITTSVPVILAGLGIGAYFVRALTLSLLHGGTLQKLIYLEHGAHWAIFVLALCMLSSLITPVPEWFTATAGLVPIALSFFSSRKNLRIVATP